MLYDSNQSRRQQDRPDRDHASGDGMPLHQLEDLLSDIQNQPEWRDRADKCAGYYDGKQLSSDRLAQMDETGEPRTIVNLIQRTVNGALGNEAKSRLDWKAESDKDAFADVSDVLGERLHEAQRETWADMAMSNAYAGELIPGIGWVEVSRNPDPLAYPYRVLDVHRNEVWWDWRAKMADKSDGRWICRQQWTDLDEAEVWLPQFADVFRLGCHSGPITDAMMQTILASQTFDRLESTRRSFSRHQEEWLDNSLRQRVRFYDIHYKQPKVMVALVTGTRRQRFNERNPLHIALLQRGKAQLVKGPSFVIRRALFAGPFRLFDVETKWRRYPLIPFTCYTDDEDGTPYGLVAGMIDPQDEYNERRSRLRWLLKAAQVFVDHDALKQDFNTFEDLALEVMRPDGFFVMNADRQNADGLRVERNLQLSQEQVAVMQDAKVLIQEVPGVYNAMLGQNSDNVKSGVALNSLVEQSITSLGETSDNYRMSRRAVGEALQTLIMEDLGQVPNAEIEVGTGRKARVVVLNTFTPEGIPVNHVDDAAVRIGLADAPSTPAHRQQQSIGLGNALSTVGNDPDARAVLLPAFIESTDLENRHVYAKWLRQKYGVPEPGEVDDQAMDQQQKLVGLTQQLQLRGADADVRKKEADATKAELEVAQGAQGMRHAEDQRSIDNARGMQEMQAADQEMQAQQQPSEDDIINDAIAQAHGGRQPMQPMQHAMH